MKQPPVLLATALLLPVLAHAQTTIVSEDFSDNSRTNQSLPTSTQWFINTSNNSTLTVGTYNGDQELLMTSGATGDTRATQITTYFAPSNSPVVLQDGQTITVSFNLNLQVNTPSTSNLIHFGLYNSGGTRITGDTTNSTNSSAFAGYLGYKTVFNPNSTSQPYNIWERKTGSTNPSLFASTDHTRLGSENFASIGAPSGTAFDIAFSITRTDNSYSISSTVDGIELTREDTSVSTFSFDTFALLIGTQTLQNGQHYRLDDFNVSLTAIPEPSSAALLFGGLTLGFASLRRRRK